MAKKVAFKKNASQLDHEVKIYDPFCKYDIGDLIYKEYDELLTISSKGAEHFRGEIVLKVINKISYESFNCEMLEVDFTGGGTFRKHIDFLKKTKTQALLPSNQDLKAKTPALLKKDEDPRLTELPMTDKDLKSLERNLRAALTKSPDFFNWNDHWQLENNRIEIPKKVIKGIEKLVRETKQAADTKDLVHQFFKLETEDDLFELHCLSLNYTIEKEFKKNIIFASPAAWGSWILKEILDSFLVDLPLSAPKAEVPAFKGEKEDKTLQENFPLKVYLTWREILSGGLRIPKSVDKLLSHSRKYTFRDLDKKKDYTVYYYPSRNIFIGLKEFYEENNVPQGAGLTLEKTGLTNIRFSLKKSKKKLSVPNLSYNPKSDKFTAAENEDFTYSLPNKIIYLESETINKLLHLQDKIENLDLQELLILIFKNFGLEGDTLSLHFSRAYHLIDVLKHTTQETVEKVLSYSPEFIRSEKNVGIFLYREKIKSEEEITFEAAQEFQPESIDQEIIEMEADDDLPEIGTVGEIADPEGLTEVEAPEPVEEVAKPKEPEVGEVKEEPVIEEKPEPVPPPQEEIKPSPEVKKEIKPPAPKKEKEPKKKRRKPKPEIEKGVRRRKSEKKFIEEKIELEESELEALIAVKAKTKKETFEEKKKAPVKEKKEDFKPFISQESLTGGLFGEKLKSALDKKKAEPKKEKPKKRATKKAEPKKKA
jgi:hypothetical protein